MALAALPDGARAAETQAAQTGSAHALPPTKAPPSTAHALHATARGLSVASLHAAAVPLLLAAAAAAAAPRAAAQAGTCEFHAVNLLSDLSMQSNFEGQVFTRCPSVPFGSTAACALNFAPGGCDAAACGASVALSLIHISSPRD